MSGPVSQSLLFTVALVAVMLWLAGRVARKAGYPGWWAIPVVIPFVNILMVWIFAHANWPRLRPAPRPRPPDSPGA